MAHYLDLGCVGIRAFSDNSKDSILQFFAQFILAGPYNVVIVFSVKVQIFQRVKATCENHWYSEGMCKSGFIVNPATRSIATLGKVRHKK